LKLNPAGQCWGFGADDLWKTIDEYGTAIRNATVVAGTSDRP
jgi:hypothetical protein